MDFELNTNVYKCVAQIVAWKVLWTINHVSCLCMITLDKLDIFLILFSFSISVRALFFWDFFFPSPHSMSLLPVGIKKWEGAHTEGVFYLDTHTHTAVTLAYIPAGHFWKLMLQASGQWFIVLTYAQFILLFEHFNQHILA